MTDEAHVEKWGWKQSAAAAVILGALVWVIAISGSMETSQRLSNAGQALGSLASGAAVIAVVMALRQLEVQRNAFREQVAASAREHRLRGLEELRSAYVTWLAKNENVLQMAGACATYIKSPLQPQAHAELLALVNHLHAQSTHRWSIQLLESDSERLARAQSADSPASAVALRVVKEVTAARSAAAEGRGFQAEATFAEVFAEIRRSLGLIADFSAELRESLNNDAMQIAAASQAQLSAASTD